MRRFQHIIEDRMHKIVHINKMKKSKWQKKEKTKSMKMVVVGNKQYR